MAQIASDIVDKCKYIHPSRVEEIEQLLVQSNFQLCEDKSFLFLFLKIKIKLRKHSIALSSTANSVNTNNAVSNGSNRQPDIATYNDSESFSSSENHGRNNGASKYNNSSSIQKEKDRYNTNGTNQHSQLQQQQSQHQPTVLEQLPAAYMNELDDYLDMLYQVGGKTEKEKDVGLKMQERCTHRLFCII